MIHTRPYTLGSARFALFDMSPDILPWSATWIVHAKVACLILTLDRLTCRLHDPQHLLTLAHRQGRQGARYTGQSVHELGQSVYIHGMYAENRVGQNSRK